MGRIEIHLLHTVSIFAHLIVFWHKKKSGNYRWTKKSVVQVLSFGPTRPYFTSSSLLLTDSLMIYVLHAYRIGGDTVYHFIFIIVWFNGFFKKKMTWINWYIIREDLTYSLSLRSLHFHGSYPEDTSYMLMSRLFLAYDLIFMVFCY